MQTPDRSFRMEFRSIPTPDATDTWMVHVHFPANVGGDAELPIDAVGLHDVPIEKGVFEFMGCKCPIESGRGAIRYADFVAGIHEKAVWMYRPNRMTIPGGLTFA